MGVIPCDRNNCENIMCDHYISRERVCDDCLEEFKSIVLSPNTREILSIADMNSEFHAFMETRKGTLKIRNNDVFQEWFEAFSQ